MNFLQDIQLVLIDKAREMILNFYAQQVPLEVIAKASELTLEEVQNIIKDSQNKKENS